MIQIVFIHCDDGEKSKLINELNKLFVWIKKNEFSMNISKTQVLQIHGKNDLTLELDGELLFKQRLVTYLGIKLVCISEKSYLGIKVGVHPSD